MDHAISDMDEKRTQFLEHIQTLQLGVGLETFVFEIQQRLAGNTPFNKRQRPRHFFE